MNTLITTRLKRSADLNIRAVWYMNFNGSAKFLVLTESAVLKIFSIINSIVQMPASIIRIDFTDFIIIPLYGYYSPVF